MSAVALDRVPKNFVRHRFVPTTVYVREGDGFHTRLCVYNYFSELFPQVTTGATVYMWFFDTSGAAVAHREVHLGYRGQLQFDLADLGLRLEGTAGLSMVPDTLPEFKPSGVGTGYYAYYYDDEGHGDFSHEWEPMRFEPVRSQPWLCLVRPLLFPDTQLVVMSAYYGEDGRSGAARYTVRLRAGNGKILSEREMPPLPPRGSVRLPLNSIFPDVSELAGRERALSVEVVGENIQGPFTLVRGARGDFNVHHFC